MAAANQQADAQTWLNRLGLASAAALKMAAMVRAGGENLLWAGRGGGGQGQFNFGSIFDWIGEASLFGLGCCC